MEDNRLRGLKGKEILITGGAGMIGSTIANLAVLLGAKVTILDAMLPLYGGNKFNLEEIKDDIVFIEGDVRDFELIQKTVVGKEVIFDLAAQVSYKDSITQPFVDLDINCRGHLNVLEACRLHNREVKIIFPSSRFVYGSIEYNPVDERHPFNCLSIYGIHKLTAEKYLIFYHRYYGIPTIIFRIANPFGPRQQMKHNRYGILNWFIKLALEGKELTIYGEGEQIRDYIYVTDVAEAMLMAAADNSLKHDVFNVGMGIGTPFREMVRKVASFLPNAKEVHLEWPKDSAFVETGDYITDISKISRRLGWKPQVSLEEGIERTISYYQKYKDKYW